MGDRSTLLSLTAVSVSVANAHLLSDINLLVQTGERVVILGANGAGKSTLLKACNGLIAPSRGELIAPPITQQALIFQRPALLRRTVIDNVKFVLAARGVSEPLRSSHAQRAIDACGLGAMAARPAFALSGGEQQRLALARVWACRPRLLLADEPTANLAPAAMRDVEHLLLAVEALGTTLVLTTHNIAQAKRLARRIVFLDGGKVVEDRPAVDFFASPRAASARTYLEGESL